MIVRCRTAEHGIRRHEVPKEVVTCKGLAEWLESDAVYGCAIDGMKKIEGGQEVPRNDTALSNMLRHGDLVEISLAAKGKQEEVKLEVDEVDITLLSRDGRVHRKRDASACQHGSTGMCSACQPLEPFDPSLYAPNTTVKHQSLHAYLRSHQSDADEPDFGRKKVCPAGGRHGTGASCTACQPVSSVLLKQQPFRCVDHVEFKWPTLVEQFLASGWRRTGVQAFGWLFGRYAPLEVGPPLAIKAEVHAVWMPKQRGAIDGVQLVALGRDKEDDCTRRPERAALRAAEVLGLRCVGAMYSDLTEDPGKRGKLLQTRGAKSYFVSAHECVFMAAAQDAHPAALPSRNLANPKRFGSKFATVVLTGDESGSIAPQAYQCSLVGTAMLRAGIIAPSPLGPAMMRPRDAPDGSRTAPDVRYTRKNEYGVTVQGLAQPDFPTDFLIVSLTNGFPADATTQTSAAAFPPMYLGDKDGRVATNDQLQQVLVDIGKSASTGVLGANSKAALLSLDFWAFLLSKHPLVNVKPAKSLVEAVRNGCSHEVIRKRIIEFCQDEHLPSQAIRRPSSSSEDVPVRAASPPKVLRTEVPMDVDGSGWSCPHCTYLNDDDVSPDSCLICALPRD